MSARCPTRWVQAAARRQRGRQLQGLVRRPNHSILVAALWYRHIESPRDLSPAESPWPARPVPGIRGTLQLVRKLDADASRIQVTQGDDEILAVRLVWMDPR